MSKFWKIAIAAVVIVVVILLCWLSWGKPLKAMEKENLQKDSLYNKEIVALKAIAKTHSECAAKLSAEKARGDSNWSDFIDESELNDSLEVRIQVLDSLLKDCKESKVVKAAVKKTPTKATTKKVAKAPVKRMAPAPTLPAEDASYLTGRSSVQKSVVRLVISEQKFCIKLGNQFWPHLAINMGEEFPEVVSNGIGGFDLFIMPSGTIGSTGKKYGITEDGTYWIQADQISGWSQSPYFLNSRGTWVPGEQSGNYWVAK